MPIIDHVGIAVNSLEETIGVYNRILKQEPSGYATVESEGVRVAFFGETEGRVELMEPTSDVSPVARFLKRHGPGVHHVCLAVENLEEALTNAAAGGVEPIPPAIRTGADGHRVAFLHPRETGGVLLELAERKTPR